MSPSLKKREGDKNRKHYAFRNSPPLSPSLKKREGDFIVEEGLG